MTRTIWSSVLVMALAAALTAGQQDSARISGPVLGYVLDREAAALRPVFGIPGAATLGPQLDLGGEIHRSTIAQEAGYALAAVGAERRVRLIRDLEGERSSTLLADVPPEPEGMLLSPAGSAAALVYGDSVAVVTGLPGAPVVSRTFERATLLAGARIWAISDDGAHLLLSAPEAVYLLDAEGGWRFLLSTGRTAAAAFLAGSAEVVIADAAWNRVAWIRASGEVIPLAGDAEGILDPVAVGVSRDNRRVFVANAGSRAVAVLDLAGGPASLVACQCELTGLERMQGNAVFRLSDPTADPMWVFDGDAREARVVFVPAVVQAVSPAEGQAEDLPQGGSQ